MKKHPFFLSGIVMMLHACNSIEQPKENVSDTTHHIVMDTVTTTISKVDSSSSFDIHSIPVSTQDIGVFPFFSAPEGYKFNNGKTLSSGKQYFAVNGKLLPLEGKFFNAELDINQLKTQGKFNAQLVEKSYGKIIVDLGGVKVNAIPVTATEIERIGKKELLDNGYGYTLDYNGQPVHTYVIRQHNAEVWIQLYLLDQESGRITILQKSSAETLPIAILKADDLKRQIDTKGRAVLHINFDTDKADLNAESQAAVTEIEKLLQDDNTLKLSIEGHTDNAGNAAVNKKLSLERANNVMNALIKNGISKNRLKAIGYGAERPLVSNATDEGKAENRRVELVKQ